MRRTAQLAVAGIAVPLACQPALAADYDVRARESWKALTPRFALDWQATPDALVYVSATRGFKSGGFQYVPFSKGQADVLFAPEDITAYVVRLVRALDHGRYWNPLTTAKIATADRVLNVGSADLADGSGAPGTVLSAKLHR